MPTVRQGNRAVQLAVDVQVGVMNEFGARGAAQ